MIHLSKWSVRYAVLGATGLALAAVLALIAGEVSPVLGDSYPQGWNYPNAEAPDNQFGNPEKARTEEGNCDPVNCATVLPGQAGGYITFDFSIPADAGIKGIEVQLGGYNGGEGDLDQEVELQLVDENLALVGTPKVVILPADSYSQQTAGAPTDRWDLDWEAKVNDPNFGVQVKDLGGDAAGGFFLDYVKIKVHYCNDCDDDGEPNATDNCPYASNPDQRNTDEELGAAGAKMDGVPIGDELGDVCDDDDDDDTFTDTIEQYLPTNPYDNCPGAPYSELGGSDWGVDLDAWPPDFNADTVITQEDANHYLETGHFNKNADIPIRQRLDLDGDTRIYVGDYWELPPFDSWCE